MLVCVSKGPASQIYVFTCITGCGFQELLGLG